MKEWLIKRAQAWPLRLTFGALLFVFGELVSWQEAQNRDILSWLLIALIHLALGAIVLDLMVRWRVSQWWGILFSAGIYAVLQNGIVSLQIYDNIPGNFAFYSAGLQTLMFLLAIASLRLLYSGQSSRPFDWSIAALAGLGSGIWLRWYPEIEDVNQPVLELADTGAYAVIGLILCGVLAAALPTRNKLSRWDWMLTPQEWGLAVVILGGAFAARAVNGQVEILGLGIAIVVLLVILLVLWYLGTTFINEESDIGPLFLFNTQKTNTLGWVLVLIPLTLAMVIGYYLPGESEPIQATILFFSMSVFGLTWMPLICIYVGFQVFTQIAADEY